MVKRFPFRSRVERSNWNLRCSTEPKMLISVVIVRVKPVCANHDLKPPSWVSVT